MTTHATHLTITDLLDNIDVLETVAIPMRDDGFMVGTRWLCIRCGTVHDEWFESCATCAKERN